MIVNNNECAIKYFDISCAKFKTEKDIIEAISKDISVFNDESCINHEQNSSIYNYLPDVYKPVLKNIFPIPSKSSWSFSNENFLIRERPALFRLREFKKKDLILKLNKYIDVLKNKNIGVQLSGGLDSSLLIGVLKQLGIQPTLIGMFNSRYEFRTERIIQEIIKENTKKAILINDDNFLPFSDLLNVPIHPIPNPSSLFYSSENKMAELFLKNNVDIVFNGMGLDTILCLSPRIQEHRDQWHPFMFDNCWFQEYVYKPKNIFFTPAVNRVPIVNFIWNARINSSEDNSKKWARNYFSEFLPKELVNFSYKADHAGLLIDGITSNFDVIEYLFSFVYEKTKLNAFSQNQFIKLFRDYHLDEDIKTKLILSRTSFAVWIHSCIHQ
jgi:hypothetical protein